MMRRVLLMAVVIFLSTYAVTAQQLVERWRTDTVFKAPESVLFDKNNNRLYVSNINGKSDVKDGNGFISILSVDGKIINLNWIDGLNAPKGMAVYNNSLYVADIDRLVEIDIARAQIINTYTNNKAVFLNDVAVDNKGVVYVSDSRGNQLFRYKNGVLEHWLQHGSFAKTNGLFTEGRFLYVGSELIQKISTKSKKIEQLFDGREGIDGLTKIGKHRFLYSNWVGKICIVDRHKTVCMLDLRNQKINTADFDFAVHSQTLFVPTFFDNRVIAYQLNLK